MASTPFVLLDAYASIQNVSAKDLNRRSKIEAVQLGGLLKAIGAGVSHDPVSLFDSLLVVSDTGTVSVTQGQGFVADANDNVYWFRTIEDTVITPIGSTQCYVYAEYIEPAADAATPETAAVDDTDTTGEITLVVSESDSLANAIQLASIDAAGVVTDTRAFVRWDTTSAEIANILTWLGYTSSIYTSNGTIQARLAALEGAGSSVISNIAQLAISASDTRNAATAFLALEARVTALETGGATAQPMQQQTDILTHELAIARQTTIALQPPAGERSASANIEKTVEGIYGDGSDGYPDHLIDATVAINEDGEFEA